MPLASRDPLLKRVEDLEELITTQEVVHVSTTIVVVARGEEPTYLTVPEALEASTRLALAPPLLEVRRFSDLSVLIDPVKGTRKLRHKQSPLRREAYDALAAKARHIDVEIHCHEDQVDAILSDAPIIAVFGGNRAGKTKIEQWWLFRRWLLRGGVSAVFWWVGPDLAKAIKYGAHEIAGPMGQGGGLWPDAIFTHRSKITLATKEPMLHMIDGSSLAFMHAHHSGNSAGDNLKSANIRDAVVDEINAIGASENWTQVLARVSQSGGSVCTASTRKRGHWSKREIDELVATAGEDVIRTFQVDLFDNPWMAYAAIWKLFLSDGTLTRRQLEADVLQAGDPPGRARALVSKPRSREQHFGDEIADGSRLWSEWDAAAGVVTHGSTPWATDDEGQAARLVDITAQVLRPHVDGRPPGDSWAGADFNFIGHSVILKVFGRGASVEQAVAAKSTWSVLVASEVESEGSSLRHGQALAAKLGRDGLVYCDPQGEMQGHAGRTTGSNTDAHEFRHAGLRVYPANGYETRARNSATPPAARQINRSDSINVMHRLMRERRFFVDESCEGVLDALANDKHTKGGGHSASDRRSGYTDAVRYGVWPVFRHLVTQAASIET